MKGILEGLFYVVGDQGLTIKEISDILEIEEEETKKLVRELANDYLSNERGLKISYLGNSYKLTTKEEHKEYYQKLLDDSNNNTLSPQALETLAVIAYNEPITRQELDEIRGIDSVYTLRRLIAKGLVMECGKSEKIGHPLLYKTTNEFLDYFGLSTIDDLPKIESIEKEDEDKDLFTSAYKDN